jgi:hypothetical protein
VDARIACIVTALLVALWPADTHAQAPARCDRACLEAHVDRYVDAVLAHAPERVPTAAGVRFRENGQLLRLGDGLWHTATGRGGYRLVIADVEAQQVVLMGTIREGDAPTVLVARLGLVDGRVAEIETMVIRNAAAAGSLDAIGTPRAALVTAVPAHARHTRSDLIQIANQYFSGIERNDGRGTYPLSDTCARLENGTVSAGDPAAVLPPRLLEATKAAGTRPRSTCRAQFESGVFFYVTRIRDRRFMAIDPERGLAFAFAFFDNAGGDSRFGTLADGRTVESGPKIPWTWQIAEVFKIEGGLIGPVESVLHQVPYGMVSGWGPWDAAMTSAVQSSGARDGAAR